MQKLTRLFLMWLLVLALPVQGVAAASMLHCGPARGNSPGAVAQGQGHDHARHAHAGHAADEALQAQPADHAAAVDDDLLVHDASQVGCSACASCCSATAIPAAPLVLAPSDPVHTVNRAIAFDVVAFLTGGPERPPRSSLAQLVR